MAVAHLSPLQDSTHLGCGGNPGVLVPRPCSTVQCCQGTSVGTTAGLISKPLHRLGYPASLEEHIGTLSLCSPPQTSTGFTVPAAQHPQLPSGNAGQAAGRERSRLHPTGDMTPSLISLGGKGGGRLHPPGSGAPVPVKANFDAEGSLCICHYYSCHHQAKHGELTLWRRTVVGVSRRSNNAGFLLEVCFLWWFSPGDV